MTINYLTILVSFLMVLTIAGLSNLLKQTVVQPLQVGVPDLYNKFPGMWMTADGYIRRELLSNGRYEETRGNGQAVYTGNYEITGNRIKYMDDAGFTATGNFNGNVLYHDGHIFYREIQQRFFL